MLLVAPAAEVGRPVQGREVTDRILVMERGAIIEKGTHAQLLEEEGLYARLFRAGEAT